MEVYDNTHPAIQDHKLQAKLSSTAHKARQATQLIKHESLPAVQALFGGGYIVVNGEGVHLNGAILSDDALAALLTLLQGDEAAPPHPDPVGRAKFLLRTQGKLELEAAIRSRFNVRFADIKSDGSVQVLDGGLYRYLTEEELTSVI